MKDPAVNSATKFSALVVAASSSFLTPFTISSVNIALPSIERDFQINALLLSWIATSYLLSAAIFLLPFGKLGDIYGRKKIFRYGIIIFTISSFLAAFSNSAGMLIFSRIIQGLGSAMIFATGIAIISSVFPPEERGKALGITVAAVYSGLSCGPFFGGFLTQHFTWRSIFVVNIPLGIVIILLILFKLKGEWADAKGEKFDVTGSVIYGLSLIALMCGVTLLPDISGFVLIVAGFFGLFLFFKWEKNIRYPVFDVNLFGTNRVFAFSCFAALDKLQRDFFRNISYKPFSSIYKRTLPARRRNDSYIPADNDGALFTCCRKTFGQNRAAYHSVDRNGHNSLRTHIPVDDTGKHRSCPDSVLSDASRVRLCPFFFPEHECHNGQC